MAGLNWKALGAYRHADAHLLHVHAYGATDLPVMEGRKKILLMRATTEVDWHVNVWSEQINGPQIYQDKQ